MNRRGMLDAVVVGGGVVGAASALMLAREGLQVALVEARRPPAWQRERPDLRVFAFAPDNAALLDGIGAWPAVLQARVQAYRRMQVWDAGGGDALVFDADALGQPQLGWIVENALLVDRLWGALEAAGVRVHCPATVEALEQDADGVRLRLDDGVPLHARLALATDGAGSALRGMAGIEVRTQDARQRGVVGYIACERPHAQACYQRFQPGGPLALLPFADGAFQAAPGHVCSIVWSVPEADAERVLALPDEAFAQELTAASGGVLGALRPLTPRAAFPLRRQLARSMVAGRVLLLGDAAHVVHPLAGQGVNLGLRDVSALQAQLRKAGQARGDIASPQRLARWARARMADNTASAHAFDAINRVYRSDALLPVLLRGHAFGIAQRLPMVGRALWRHAAGL